MDKTLAFIIQGLQLIMFRIAKPLSSAHFVLF